MFKLAKHSPRESLFDRYHFQLKSRAVVYAIAANGVASQLQENAKHSPQDASGEDLQPEMVLPGAARIGQKS